MKFREKNFGDKWNLKYGWEGTKNGFIFQIKSLIEYEEQFWIYITHKKKDIRYNSMWSNITFTDLQVAFEWCETFNYVNFSCLGTDAKVCG